VNKRIVLNLLKYALALGLLGLVVYGNWGDPRGTVGKLVVGEGGGEHEVSGTVVAYAPPDSITIEEPSPDLPVVGAGAVGMVGSPAGQGPLLAASALFPGRARPGPTTELALKNSRSPLRFWAKPDTTQVVRPDGEPLPEGESLKVGDTVSAEDISLGLAFVWRLHVVEGQPIHAGYLALAFGIGFAAIVLTFVRWWVLVRAVGFSVRVSDAIRLGFLGFFWNTFLPGSVGGDAVKAWYLAKSQSRRTVAVATVIMDRALALWALIWFVGLLGAGFWLGGLLEGRGSEACRQIVVTTWSIVGASLLVWLLLGLLSDERAERFAGRLARLPKVGGSAAEFWRAVWIYRRRPLWVYGVVAMAWVSHVGFVLLFYFSALTLFDPAGGQRMPTLMQHFLIVPVGLVANAMPLFPGGVGIGELAFGGLYGWLGGTPAVGVLGSLVQRVVGWAVGLVGGGLYLVMSRARPAGESDSSLAPGPLSLVASSDE
jgi:uncharacterized membrane protein YbhN (UPF0104 family)